MSHMMEKERVKQTLENELAEADARNEQRKEMIKSHRSPAIESKKVALNVLGR